MPLVYRHDAAGTNQGKEMPAVSPSSLATIGQIIWRLIEFHGLDPASLFREADIDPETIRDPHARIDNRRGDVLLRLAAERIPDPAFGLHGTHCWHPSNLGALGYAWLASSTLHKGLARLVRFWRIINVEANIQLRQTRDGVEFLRGSSRSDPIADAVGGDIAIAIIVDMCRMNYGNALTPLRVGFRRERPKDMSQYERLFGCRAAFGRDFDSFVLKRAVADFPLPTSNRQLAAVHDRILMEELARLDRNDVLTRARAALLERLATGEVSEEILAADLNVSRRTLQRRLADGNTTYESLLDATRRDLALRYIDDPAKSIIEIAFLLGYSQHSVFTRAFRRWTGRSPTDFRTAPLKQAS